METEIVAVYLMHVLQRRSLARIVKVENENGRDNGMRMVHARVAYDVIMIKCECVHY